MLIFLGISDLWFSKSNQSLITINSSDIEYLQLGLNNKSYTQEKDWVDFNKNSTIEYFNFDPNTIGNSEWERLGFSDKQANAIIAYRTNTGGFKKKEDLKKVFVISEKKYKELEPFIQITAQLTNSEEAKKKNINLAIDSDLQALPGIGPKLSERILKYRQALGGFASLTQLHEVYGITEDLYQILIEHFVQTNEGIKKIVINAAGKEEIDKHPYITWPMTASILKKRDQEKIVNLNFLVESGIANQEEIERLEPYISFE